jgi:hypothetical protein
MLFFIWNLLQKGNETRIPFFLNSFEKTVLTPVASSDYNLDRDGLLFGVKFVRLRCGLTFDNFPSRRPASRHLEVSRPNH